MGRGFREAAEESGRPAAPASHLRDYAAIRQFRSDLSRPRGKKRFVGIRNPFGCSLSQWRDGQHNSQPTGASNQAAEAGAGARAHATESGRFDGPAYFGLIPGSERPRDWQMAGAEGTFEGAAINRTATRAEIAFLCRCACTEAGYRRLLVFKGRENGVQLRDLHEVFHLALQVQ